MNDALVTLSSCVVVSPQVVSCDLAGEAAILDMQSGFYYGLNAIGSHLWRLIQTPQTVMELCQAIVEAYEVTPDRCERDVLALLQELADAGLIEVNNAAPL
jgi:hypothetical protein